MLKSIYINRRRIYMNPIKHRFTLDMHSAQSQISIPALLGDTGRELHITLTDGGNPYTITDGCLAKISIKRPTETYLEEFCAIEGGTTVVYPFSTNTCVVEGIHNCDVTLYDAEGDEIASPRFTMVVSERAINSDDINLSDEDRTAISAMIAAEASRQEAETGRINNEATRVTAETARIDAETGRESSYAELERDFNEVLATVRTTADELTALLGSSTAEEASF
jgi:hypothetical protein